MECPMCGNTDVRALHQPYHYPECGLDYVYLDDVEYIRCDVCRDEYVSILREDEVLTQIAQYVVAQPYRLRGAEIRFLRVELNWSQEELARRLGVGRLTILRWESDEFEPDLARDILFRIVWMNAFLEWKRSEGATRTKRSGTVGPVRSERLGLDRLLASLDCVPERIRDGKRPRLTYDVRKRRLRSAA